MVFLRYPSLVFLLAWSLVSLHTPPAEAATGFAVGPKFALAMVNTAPVLSNGGVYPGSGNPSTEFSFTVLYTDPDNDSPAALTIQIDSQPLQAMLPVSAEDSQYTDGALYVYKTRLAAGNHTYKFAATDLYNLRATGESAAHAGPAVRAAGVAAELSNGSVSPLTGGSTTEFTFSVNYTHADNLPPTQIAVAIDGQSKTLQPVGGSVDYLQGVTYQHKTKLPAGSHGYAFSAQQAGKKATGDTVAHVGPVVVSGPMSGLWSGLSSQGVPVSFVVAEDGQSVQNFTFGVRVSRTYHGVFLYSRETCSGGTCTTEYIYGDETRSETVSSTVARVDVSNSSFRDANKVSGAFPSPVTATGTATLSDSTVTWTAAPSSGGGSAATSPVTITGPASNALVNKTPITVTGTVQGAQIRTAELNGTPVTLSQGTFSTQVALRQGANTLKLVAYDANRGVIATYTTKVTLDSRAPRIVLSQPQPGQVIRDTKVTVQGMLDDASILVVKVNRAPVPVIGRQFRVQVPLVRGNNNIPVEATDAAGNTSRAQVSVSSQPPGSPSGKEVVEGVPTVLALSDNYPNPFNPETAIAYQLPASGLVRLEIYNVLGQQVRTLVDQVQPAGFYRETWDGNDNVGQPAASGVYLCRLESGPQVAFRRMLLLR